MTGVAFGLSVMLAALVAGRIGPGIRADFERRFLIYCDAAAGGGALCAAGSGIAAVLLGLA